MLASFPGHSQILSRRAGERHKICQWPGDKANLILLWGIMQHQSTRMLICFWFKHPVCDMSSCWEYWAIAASKLKHYIVISCPNTFIHSFFWCWIKGMKLKKLPQLDHIEFMYVWYTCIHAVPTTPISNVCVVYEMVNRTLQIIENMWKELVSWGQSAISTHWCSYLTINYSNTLKFTLATQLIKPVMPSVAYNYLRLLRHSDLVLPVFGGPKILKDIWGSFIDVAIPRTSHDLP